MMDWERPKRMQAMRREGMTYAAIGRAFGISDDRVKQLICKLERRDRAIAWRKEHQSSP